MPRYDRAVGSPLPLSGQKRSAAALDLGPDGTVATLGTSGGPRCFNCGSYGHTLNECWRELDREAVAAAKEDRGVGQYRTAPRRYFLAGAPELRESTPEEGQLGGEAARVGTSGQGPTWADADDEFIPVDNERGVGAPGGDDAWGDGRPPPPPLPPPPSYPPPPPSHYIHGEPPDGTPPPPPPPGMPSGPNNGPSVPTQSGTWSSSRNEWQQRHFTPGAYQRPVPDSTRAPAYQPVEPSFGDAHGAAAQPYGVHPPGWAFQHGAWCYVGTPSAPHPSPPPGHGWRGWGGGAQWPHEPQEETPPPPPPYP